MKAKRNPELSRENSEESPKVKVIKKSTSHDDTKCVKIGLGDGPQVLGSTPPASPPVTGRPTTAARQVSSPTLVKALKSALDQLFRDCCCTGKRKTIIIATEDRSIEVSQASFSSTCGAKSQVL